MSQKETVGVRTSENPLATQRSDEDPFTEQADDADPSPPPQMHKSRRMSKEWDAAKVPPSRFQKREGSFYATPSSRDGHVDRNTQTAFTAKLKEKGWLK